MEKHRLGFLNKDLGFRNHKNLAGNSKFRARNIGISLYGHMLHLHHH